MLSTYVNEGRSGKHAWSSGHTAERSGLGWSLAFILLRALSPAGNSLHLAGNELPVLSAVPWACRRGTPSAWHRDPIFCCLPSQAWTREIHTECHKVPAGTEGMGCWCPHHPAWNSRAITAPGIPNPRTAASLPVGSLFSILLGGKRPPPGPGVPSPPPLLAHPCPARSFSHLTDTRVRHMPELAGAFFHTFPAPPRHAHKSFIVALCCEGNG